MQINLNSRSYGTLSSAFAGLFGNLLHRVFAVALLVSLIVLSGLPTGLALAAPNLPGIAIAPAQPERLKALISCLPKQLSQPDSDRTWGEMGNDQIERALGLKANPKLSQAETELAACMSQQGFAPLS
jgi:hypothetical protein